MVEHESRRSRRVQQRVDEGGHRPAQNEEDRLHGGAPAATVSDAEGVPRERDARPDARLVKSNRTQSAPGERADEAPVEKAVAPESTDDAVNRAALLEVDVDADPGGLVGEELQRLVERGEVWAELTQLRERLTLDRSLGSAVAHFVQVAGVRDDELAVVQREHVELDEIHADGNGGPERLERVLRREERRAAVADAERPPLSSLERDHGRVGR